MAAAPFERALDGSTLPDLPEGCEPGPDVVRVFGRADLVRDEQGRATTWIEVMGVGRGADAGAVCRAHLQSALDSIPQAPELDAGEGCYETALSPTDAASANERLLVHADEMPPWPLSGMEGLGACAATRAVLVTRMPSEAECQRSLARLQEYDERSRREARISIDEFYDRELRRAKELMEASCARLAAATENCGKRSEIEDAVHVACSKPASDACAEARKALLDASICSIEVERLTLDCETGRSSVELIQRRRAETPAELPGMQPRCLAPASGPREHGS